MNLDNLSTKAVDELATEHINGMYESQYNEKELILCEGCYTMKHSSDQDKNLCGRCWPEYAEANGLCEECGTELEPIYENNGFTMPNGPEHWDISGYKPCADCAFFEE